MVTLSKWVISHILVISFDNIIGAVIMQARSFVTKTLEHELDTHPLGWTTPNLNSTCSINFFQDP